MPEYTLDLDLPPSERWKGLKQSTLDALRLHEEESFNIFYMNKAERDIARLPIKIIDTFLKNARAEYIEEIKSLATEAGVSMSYIILNNYVTDHDSISSPTILERDEDNKVHVYQNFGCEIFEHDMMYLQLVNYKMNGRIIGHGFHRPGNIGPVYLQLGDIFYFCNPHSAEGPGGKQGLSKIFQDRTDEELKEVSPQTLINREIINDYKNLTIEGILTRVQSMANQVPVSIAVGDRTTAHIVERNIKSPGYISTFEGNGPQLLVSKSIHGYIEDNEYPVITSETVSGLLNENKADEKAIIKNVIFKKPYFLIDKDYTTLMNRTTSTILYNNGETKFWNWS